MIKDFKSWYVLMFSLPSAPCLIFPRQLCSIPRIIENTASVCPLESWKENEAHVCTIPKIQFTILICPIKVVLHEYRYTPHTIVLDSRCPDLAPHIVITPPDEYSEDPWAAHNNRVDSQTAPNLCVPPFYMTTCRLATYYEWMNMFYPPPALQSEEPTQQNHFSFNLGSFVEYVCFSLPVLSSCSLTFKLV